MKITNVTTASKIYTSNVYLVTGTWNSLDDINTLVDVGRDSLVIEKINNARTGVAKPKVEQVILTHSHYDHAELLPLICETYKPVVYGFTPFPSQCQHHRNKNDCSNYKKLYDGVTLKLGDRLFEVIYTPGHSSDSICLYCEEDGVLFAGDSNIIIDSVDGTYEKGFISAMEKLVRRDVRAIYFGHGSPMFQNCNARLRSSLLNVKKAVNNANCFS